MRRGGSRRTSPSCRSRRVVKTKARGRKGLGALRERAPKNSNHTQREIAALLTSGKVGSLGLIVDNKDVVILLQAAVEKEGSISAFAKRHGLERTNLSYFPRCHAKAYAACCDVPMPPAPARSRQKTSSGVSLSQCLQLVRYGSIGGDPRLTEISFCDHYDSRALSDLCRLCICGGEGVGPLTDLDRADLNSVTIAAKHQYESHLAFP